MLDLQSLINKLKQGAGKDGVIYLTVGTIGSLIEAGMITVSDNNELICMNTIIKPIK